MRVTIIGGRRHGLRGVWLSRNDHHTTIRLDGDHVVVVLNSQVQAS